MNYEIFSSVGYFSIAIAATVPLFWFFHWVSKRKKWLVHFSLLVALLAFGFAKYNSKFYVERIQEDESERIAADAKKEEKRLRKLEEERADDVAQIRFAEDGDEDFIDRGGMDETDLRLHGLKEEKKKSDPLANMEKKERSQKETTDNSLTNSINSKEKKEGAKAGQLEKKAEPSAILKAKDMQLANLIDSLNLKFIRWLMLISVIYIIIDYCKRGNKKDQSYFPLPLPSYFFNTFTPLHAPIADNSESERKKPVLKELLTNCKRNEPFLYMSDSNVIDSLPNTAPRFMKKYFSIDILPLQYENTRVHDDFIFESLWYARCCFFSKDSDEAQTLLVHFIPLMAERLEARAFTKQNVHIVWDFSEPLPDNTIKLFSQLGNATGIYLHLLNPTS